MTTPKLIFFFILLFLSAFNGQANPIKKGWYSSTGLIVGELTCEYQKNPLGVGTIRPRLGWVLSDEKSERGQYQTAFCIQVASSEQLLLSNKPDSWNSEKIHSIQSNNIIYNGKYLASGMSFYWRVKVWDKHNQVSGWSKISYWQMGLLNKTDWKGTWIGDTTGLFSADSMRFKDNPAPIFRREFNVAKKIKKATLHVSGIGYYEAFLNGNKIGNHLLDPGWTDYSKTVLYSTYDVTSSLQPGGNCLGMLLGNGWYDPLPLLMWGRVNIREGLTVGHPKFIVQMNIQYMDGTTAQVISDDGWRATSGPIIRNSIYLGEIYDARKEIPGWNKPGINTDNWRSVTIAKPPTGKLLSQQQPPIVAGDSLSPQVVKKTSAGNYIVDFGKNFSGIIRLKATGKPGSAIQIRYGELLYPDGSLNVMTTVAGQIKRKNVGGIGAPDTAYAKDIFIIGEQGNEIFQTHFTFHAFRYAEVSGYPGGLKPADIKGLVLHSDVPVAGSFVCSDTLINQIQQVCLNTFLSNIFSVQSDCPHRERFGYGGDIVATSETFMNNFDMSGFYEKTVNDFVDAAQPDGGLTETAPFVGIADDGLGGKSGPVEWGSALPVLMLQLHQYYGNIELIKQQYPVAKKWVDFMAKHADHGIISATIGDHESIDPKIEASSATAFYYYNTKILVQFATILSKQDDVVKYTALAADIKAAFIAKFFDHGTGNVDIHTAAAQAYGLYFKLIPDGSTDAVLKVLLNNITTLNKGHISSGIFGTKFILEVLSKAGYSDIVYKMVTNKTFPGWGYMLQNGATTLWEHWALSENTFSHNHPMFGTVSEWFYRHVAGIRPSDDAIGFNKIIIQPQTGNLKWVKASYKSVLGKISTEWKKSGDILTLDITIPVNAIAMIYIPGKLPGIKEGGRAVSKVPDIHFVKSEKNNSIFQIGSGEYHFTVSL